MINGCNLKNQNQEKDTTVQSVDFQPHIELLDPRLKEILDPGAEVEIIAEGFEWAEGPLWIDKLGLLFSDIPPNKVFLWTPEDSISIYLDPSGYTGKTPRAGEKGSNGLLLDNRGRLVLCQHGDRRMARMISSVEDPAPVYKTIVDNYLGKKFNSPNDACYNTTGDLYFTDPAYGLENKMSDPLKELEFQGVYKFTNRGDLHLLTGEMTRPNGIAFSPDEKMLYLANSDPDKAVWMAFTLDDEGLIASQKIFYNATSFVDQEAGLPDGLKVDQKGNIFATGPGGVWIFNEDAQVLGKIRTGQATSNCTIGNDGKVLYITADMYVMKVILST